MKLQDKIVNCTSKLLISLPGILKAVKEGVEKICFEGGLKIATVDKHWNYLELDLISQDKTRD